MTVNTKKITSGPYTGNGIADTFSYGFKAIDKTDLIVYETDDAGVETVLTVDTDYTVDSVGNDGGGTITRIDGALPTGYEWYIRSNYDETQLTAFTSQGPFFPDLHENAMDKLTFLIQQLLDEKSRSPSVSKSYSGDIPLTMDDPESGKYLRWKEDLSGLENVENAPDPEPTPELTSSSVLKLSNYYEPSDTRISQPWSRMLADIQLVGSSSYGILDIRIDRSPIVGDSGVWKIENPCQLLSGMTVNVNDTQIEWVNTDTSKVFKRARGMFEAIGTSANTAVNITSNITRGSNELTVADASGMTVGGYVSIEIENTVDQTTGIFPLLFDFAKVTKITGNVILVSTVIDWDVDLSVQDTATVQFFNYEDVPKNITFTGARFLDSGTYVVNSTPPLTVDPVQPDYVIGPLFFQYVDNITVDNCRGQDLKCPLAQFREYTNCTASNMYSNRPLAISAGEGYTVQMSRGNRGLQYRNGGYETRHVGDFTSAYDCKMIDCWDDTPDIDGVRVSFLLHGRYESKLELNGLTGLKLGLGAGFDSFGNFMQDITFKKLKVGKLEGRGAIGKCSIDDSYIGYTGGTLYWEDMTVNNTYINTGDTLWKRETRLSTPIDTNGLRVTGSTKLRAIAFTGFDVVSLGKDILCESGGVTINEVLVTDVNKTTIDGTYTNQRLKFTGDCREVIQSPTCKMTAPNSLGNDGFIASSSITTKLKMTLGGEYISEYTGLSLHRPFKFQSGDATYEIELYAYGLKCTGQWNGGGQIFNDLTVSGEIKACKFDNLSALNYVDTGGVRRAFPSTLRVGRNKYTDETRNYDNVEHVITETVFSSIAASGYVESAITVPAWLDLSLDATVHASLQTSGSYYQFGVQPVLTPTKLSVFINSMIGDDQSHSIDGDVRITYSVI